MPHRWCDGISLTHLPGLHISTTQRKPTQMHKLKTISAVGLAAALLTVGASAADAANWYVDPAGNDSNTCTSPGPTSACKTITAASGKASAGDTINVAIGLY